MAFVDTAKTIPGLTHFYTLNSTYRTLDLVGSLHGTNYGATFGTYAGFTGRQYIQLPNSPDFSVTGTGGLSILVFLTIDNWKGVGGGGDHGPEFIHWMGKGSNAQLSHEWTFRHYIDASPYGEAPQRQGRTSFYHFRPAGGEGAGSNYQDTSEPRTERMILATCNTTQTQLYVNGVFRDSDPLSGYSVVPAYSSVPPRIGTRGDNTGFLVGKIRRVGFWNRVLTASQVTTLWAARGLTDAPPPTPTTRVTIAGATRTINNVNAARLTNYLTLYNRVGTRTATTNIGTEVVVVNGIITQVNRNLGNTLVPANGYVLSGHGTSKLWLEQYALVNRIVT